MTSHQPLGGSTRMGDVEPSVGDGLEPTIAVLGDSIAYGWGVLRSQSYPSLLQRWLDRDMAPSERWRVINAGVPGDTALMGCFRYEQDVAPFRPQIVLLHFGLNDGALRRTRFDADRERLWRAGHEPWSRLLEMWKRVRGWVPPPRDARDPTVESVEHEPLPRVQPRFYVAGLGDLVRRVRRHGGEPYLLSLTPVSRERVGDAQWTAYSRYDRLITHAAMRSGAPLIRLSDVAREPLDEEEMLALDGVHLTASGQEWLARALYHSLWRG